MNIVLLIFFFVVLYFFELGYIWIARRKKIEDNPEARSSHTTITVRGGGIIFYVAMLAYFIYAGFPFPYFFIGLTILSLISFVDDIHSLSPKTRLVCQMLAMALMAMQVSTSSVGITLLILIMSTGVVNVVNFMDGINGMLCGVSLVSLGSLLYINYDIIEFVDPALIWVILIADIAFCCFNFKKKADCFAGDVGSMSMGYILFFLVIKLIWKSNNIGWVMLLLPFLVDGFLTIGHRIILRENILLPHRKHAYEIMANELRIPHIAVSLIYMSIQAVCILLFIWKPTLVTASIEATILIVAYVAFKGKYYPLHVASRINSKEIAFQESKTVMIIGPHNKIQRYKETIHLQTDQRNETIDIDSWDEGLIIKYKPECIYLLDYSYLLDHEISDLIEVCKKNHVSHLILETNIQ